MWAINGLINLIVITIIIFIRKPTIKNITVYGCWAHACRNFVDALNEDNRLATEALCFIRKIYKVESDTDKAGLNADERKELRLKISYPTMRLFEARKGI